MAYMVSLATAEEKQEGFVHISLTDGPYYQVPKAVDVVSHLGPRRTACAHYMDTSRATPQ